MRQGEELKCSHLSAPASGLASSAKRAESCTPPGQEVLVSPVKDSGSEPEVSIRDGLPRSLCVLSFQLS